jgi:hypothetical protein
LRFTGRKRQFLSAFGEHLIGEDSVLPAGKNHRHRGSNLLHVEGLFANRGWANGLRMNPHPCTTTTNGTNRGIDYCDGFALSLS